VEILRGSSDDERLISLTALGSAALREEAIGAAGADWRN